MNMATFLWLIWAILSGIMLITTVVNITRLVKANFWNDGARFLSGLVGLFLLLGFVGACTLTYLSFGNPSTANEVLFAIIFGFIGTAVLGFLAYVHLITVNSILKKV